MNSKLIRQTTLELRGMLDIPLVGITLNNIDKYIQNNISCNII